MTEPMLDINTMIERPTIKIDGETHELISPEELSIMASTRLDGLGRKLDRQRQANDPSDDDERMMGKTLKQIVDIVMEPVPDAVRAKLSDAQKLSVIEVFSMLLMARKTKLAGATMVKQLAQQIVARLPQKDQDKTDGATEDGATSSPGSNASTAATPGAG